MYRPLLTGLCALGLFATQASAQRYSIRKPPAALDEVSIGMTLLSPCDVSMENLGNVNGIYNTAGLYDDAYIAPDSTKGTSAEDGKTYFFGYNDLIQLSDAQGNPSYEGHYLKATAVKAEAKNGTFVETGDSGLMQGVDIAYTRYFSRKHKFGITAGFNTNGFKLSRSNTWDVYVTTKSDLYRAEGIEGKDGYTGTYGRPRIFSDSSPEAYVYLNNPISLGETVLTDDVTATGAWDLTAAYVNFRLGATYNFTLSRHMILKMSGGLALVSASSRFRWNETYTAPVATITEDIESTGTDYKHKFLIGGWADIGAQYRLNRKVSLYTSLQGQMTDSLSQQTSAGHIIKLDSSSMYAMKTGFSWSF